MPDRLEQLQKLLEAEPGDVDLLYMIALEHAKAGHPAEAIAWLDKVITQDPHYHYAYYQKAQHLCRQFRTQEAKAVLDEGLKLAAADGNEKARSELAQLRQTIV
ncbi:MAG: tetratricopeptide repeat protein [Phycisphaeraceae bacterium]|nr:tetratricopeptide repeat protein [Phycisphaeraceae bacterium]